jgi:hypothetical protein
MSSVCKQATFAIDHLSFIAAISRFVSVFRKAGGGLAANRATA